MAYASLNDDSPLIQQFAIPQISKAKLQEEFQSLPSFVYLSLAEEIEKHLCAPSWDQDRNYSVGQFARNRGEELPSRLVSSPKSWLCHAGVDRREKLLPPGSEEHDIQISPLQACTYILMHLAEAWNEKMSEAQFNLQQVLVTVPASFDPSARQLILEAATDAGYPEVILLEEPQAAFYAWLYRSHDNWRKELSVGDQVLVIDIGGGTSDFSLITVADENGQLQLSRTAVGSHLLLGGDNIDLAIAHLAKNKFQDAGSDIDDWQMQSLIHASRKAKEKLFSSKSPKHIDISVMGRGSRLIGGALKTSLDHDEITNFILDGFMPLLPPNELSKVERRLGMQQIGLPYAQDPRLTCQLAKFLSQTGDLDSNNTADFIVPTAILFNGGTMKAAVFRKRIMDVVNSWAKALHKPTCKELADSDLDFAVSQGAVYYGLARTGIGIRIKSGSSRSYYIGVEEAAPAVPGMETPLNAVCVVPFDMEEGSELRLENKSFALLVGEKATFRFFSHATPKLQDGTEPVIGSVIKKWKQELSELHPIETLLNKQEGDGKTIQVQLTSKVTELGILELWCEAIDGRKWKLEFDIRK